MTLGEKGMDKNEMLTEKNLLGEEDQMDTKKAKAKGKDEDVAISRPEDEGDKEMDKSLVAEADLLKSLKKIEELTKSETPEARKQALLQKSLDGGTSEDEQAELVSLLKGETTTSEGEDLTKALSPEDEGSLSKAIDVSDALGELVSKLEKALGNVGGQLEKSVSHQGEVNLIMAKGLLDTSRLALQTNSLIKGLEGTLSEVLRLPVGGRRSAGSPGQLLHKSHAGQEPAEEQITKGQILDLLDGMVEEQVNKGQPLTAPCGEDLAKATAKVETTGDVSPSLMQDLAEFRRRRRQSSLN